MDERGSDPKRPARAAAQAREIAEFLGERCRFHANRAAEFGYAREMIEGVSANLAISIDNPLIVETEEALTRFNHLVRSSEEKVEDSSLTLFALPSAAFALGSSTAAYAVAASPMQHVQFPNPPPHWTLPRFHKYADALSEFDTELGRVSQSVWQSFYGDPYNGVRNSLFGMRQLFDHLFVILAPDDKVRVSRFFKEKEGDNPLAVSRGERLEYAAAMHVPDKKLAAYLVGQASTTLAVYKELNRAHERGSLDRERAKQAITAMEATIESWLDGIRGSPGS